MNNWTRLSLVTGHYIGYKCISICFYPRLHYYLFNVTFSFSLLVCTISSFWSYFCYYFVNKLSLLTISELFLRPHFLMMSLALRSLSVFVTSLCFSRMCMFRAASVAYSFPQLYKHGNSFFNSLAHLLTCFLRYYSLLIYILISWLFINPFIVLYFEPNESSLFYVSEIEY